MSSTALLSFVGWAFLPNLVTGWLQTLYYGITIRVGDPKPAPGTPQWVKHRRRIHITVILAYLLYTLYEADYEMRRAADFYQYLGVPHMVDDRGIKSRFRRLAARYHPDKITAAANQVSTDAVFVRLKLAQDTLLNPTKRFAYDRFGPDMLTWEHCSSIRDYMMTGVAHFAPTYVVSAVILFVLGAMGYLQWGRFWRYLASAALVLVEVYTLSRPYPPPFLSNVINPILAYTSHPPLLPFQLLILLRKATLTLFIALSQLGPLLSPPSAISSSSPNGVEPQQLMRLEQLAAANEVEATRLLSLEMAPLAGDEGGLKDLRGKVKEWLVQNTIRNDPEVRDAMGRALAKRRTGAPVGAR